MQEYTHAHTHIFMYASIYFNLYEIKKKLGYVNNNCYSQKFRGGRTHNMQNQIWLFGK